MNWSPILDTPHCRRPFAAGTFVTAHPLRRYACNLFGAAEQVQYVSGTHSAGPSHTHPSRASRGPPFPKSAALTVFGLPILFRLGPAVGGIAPPWACPRLRAEKKRPLRDRRRRPVARTGLGTAMAGQLASFSISVSPRRRGNSFASAPRGAPAQQAGSLGVRATGSAYLGASSAGFPTACIACSGND